MIPVKLMLRNFMAYKSAETLDFTDIHVACLTGENGAGKSTILDAITWALWGKARTRQDDDLIHLGESEMEVEFTFELADEVYRALRRRSSAGKGKSELHFHAHAPDAGGWRTLTEGSIRQTQDKVNRLLRLDYDTFINSAFLLQGRADEFTNRKPAERKQILGDILGLGIYDEYEERAADKGRSFGQQIGIIEAQIEQIEREVAKEPQYRQEWDAGQFKAVALNKELRRAETQLTELRQRHKELDLKQRQFDDLQSRLAQTQADIDDLAQTVTQIEGRISKFELIIAGKAQIEAGYQALQQAQVEQETWNRKLGQSSTLSTERHRLETVISQARSRLEAEARVTQSQLAQAQPKAAAIPQLKIDLNALQAELDALHAIETGRESNRQELNNLNTELARLEEENKQLKAEMSKIKDRLTQLEEAGSTCPVCTQPLNDEHRQTVLEQFTAEGTARGDAFRSNQNRSAEVKQAQKTLNAAIKQADAQLKQLRGVQSQHAKAEQALQEAENAAQTLAQLEATLQAVQTTLTEKKFEPEAGARLAVVEAELTALGYDAEAHEAAGKSMAALTHFADEFRRLQDAESRLSEEQSRLAQETSRRERLLTQTAADRETMETLKAETETLPQLARDLSTTSIKVDTLQREDRLARDAVAAARQKLDHLAYLAKERGGKEDKLAELRGIQSIYKDLRAAFGKKGVQALLIEHVIPELENEANLILSRMTDGRVNLQFITQRAAKTNDNTIETLDIRIADELGTRNYDLYSGGEAFRVNFAIRIALSKLLARRAGASLQTLVMDEGFGTQDARGRERLIEAINSIQNDFEKIIVITHIDELQGAFPSQIFVQKEDDGSRITVT